MIILCCYANITDSIAWQIIFAFAVDSLNFTWYRMGNFNMHASFLYEISLIRLWNMQVQDPDLQRQLCKLCLVSEN